MKNSPRGRFIPALAVAASLLFAGTADARATGDALDKGNGKSPAAATSPADILKSPLEMCLENVSLAMSSIKIGMQSAEQQSPDSCRGMGFQQAEAIRALKIAEEGSCNDPRAKTDERVPGALNYIRAKLAELSDAIDESCPQQALVTKCEAKLAAVNTDVTNGLLALYGRDYTSQSGCSDATKSHALARSQLHLAKGACDLLVTSDDDEDNATPRADELSAALEQTTNRVKEMAVTITRVCSPQGNKIPIDTDDGE